MRVFVLLPISRAKTQLFKSLWVSLLKWRFGGVIREKRNKYTRQNVKRALLGAQNLSRVGSKIPKSSGDFCIYLMPTTEEAHLSRSFRRKTPSVPSASPRTAICSSFLKQVQISSYFFSCFCYRDGLDIYSLTFNGGLLQVLLHDWWLIKADADSDGKRLGVGGFTSKE